MMVSPSIADIRAYILKELREDLVGPHAEQEYLSDSPTAEYLAGILYPEQLPLAEREHGQRASLEEGEEDALLVHTIHPNSQGLSCALVAGASRLQVEVAYAVYLKDSLLQTGGWRRKAYTGSFSLDLDRPAGWVELEDGGWIAWTCKREHGQRRVTVLLVNRRRWPEPQGGQEIDELCLFQPVLRLRGLGEAAVFVPLACVPGLPQAAERLVDECFSGTRPSFAIGQGCAANWGAVQDERTHEVWIEHVPAYEQEATTPVEMTGLSMLALGKARESAEVAGLVQPMLDAYEQWIRARRQEVGMLPEKVQGTAQVQLRRCGEALERMKTGLALIQQNRQVFEAFRFANQAMLYQRSQQRWAQVFQQTGKRSQEPVWEGAWRPFQLAFLLLCLPGIVDPASAERELVDVIWLPAGSGKLEAHLGLMAFTLGWRRLRGTSGALVADGGVTVILRYMLCPLPMHQFQRAAALICACEYVRRRDPQQRWGTRPFQIGLWGGGGVTPRHLKRAEEVLRQLARGEEVRQENPCQLTCCPWCGEPLTAGSYIIYRTPGARGRVRLLVTCPRPACAFSLSRADVQQGRVEKSLPVVLVDEDIYHQCPSVLVTTIDTCARLPWEPEARALFGRVNRFCPHHGYLCHTEDHSARHQGVDDVRPCAPFWPPELLIQDGLHLLAGPQGSLAGLYEAAIEQLCTASGPQGSVIRPKVVASTAIPGWMNERVKCLFAREGQIFPPAGLWREDAFFAVTPTLTQQPGRLSVGICAPGWSRKAVLVRVYALLLQIVGEQMECCEPGAVDAYTTVLGYCTSLSALREILGVVETEIGARVRSLAERRGRKARTIQRSHREFSGPKLAEIQSTGSQPGGDQRAPDLLLATALLSVGIDLAHQGVMVLSDWPGSDAEYIQLAGQIGRQPGGAGLVVTVCNGLRRRDLLYYECYRSYHQRLPWQMEKPDLAPFAPGVRDCALHAVLIAIARLLPEQWTANASASRFTSTHELVGTIREGILARVRRVDPGREEEVRQHLLALERWWQRMALSHGDALRYQQRVYRDDRHMPVLLHPAAETRTGESLPTLQSFGESDKQAHLFLSC